MPKALIVAGPNGAGKSSFIIERRLRASGFKSLNADEIAKSLARPGLDGNALDLAAGRKMLQDLSIAISQGRDVVIETTLANLTYAARIPTWQSVGYRVDLIYLSLPSADDAVARVQQRKDAGGHSIPEVDVRRRFERSLQYLNEKYRPLVDSGQLWNNSDAGRRLVEEWP